MEEIAETKGVSKFNVLCRMIRHVRSMPLSETAALLVVGLIAEESTREELARVSKELKGLVKGIESGGRTLGLVNLMGRGPGAIKSRMNDFFALHARASNELDKEIDRCQERELMSG